MDAKRLYAEALRCGLVHEERKVMSLFVERLENLACNNMHVNLGLHPRTPLTEMARYANMLIKIANKNVRTSDLSKDRPSLPAVMSNRSYVHAVMSSYDDSHKSTPDTQPRTWNCRFGDRRHSSLKPSSDKILYFRVCLENTNSLLQCPYVLKPSGLCLTKKNNF